MSRYTWILDPGHGGLGPGGEYLTPGKRSPHVPPGIYEGEFNRAICQRVVSMCPDVMVTVTNPGPVNAGLRARVKYARALQKARGNCVFISIHANAASNSPRWTSANGVVVFHHPRDKQGRGMAEWVLEAFDAHTLVSTDRGIKTSRFTVLSGTQSMPSILVECGFMTNRMEALYLGSDCGQFEIANALTQVIANYELNGGL